MKEGKSYSVVRICWLFGRIGYLRTVGKFDFIICPADFNPVMLIGWNFILHSYFFHNLYNFQLILDAHLIKNKIHNKIQGKSTIFCWNFILDKAEI